jgi:hypothetical protein
VLELEIIQKPLCHAYIELFFKVKFPGWEVAASKTVLVDSK